MLVFLIICIEKINKAAWFASAQPARISLHDRKQNGYLLFILIGLFVLLGLLLVSFFTSQNIKAQHDAFYSLGQKVALVANAAHYYIQDGEYFDSNLEADVIRDLIEHGYLPDSFRLQDIQNAAIDLRVYQEDAPFIDGKPLASAAPTAFVLADLTIPGNEMSPSNYIAYIEGALSMGLPLGLPPRLLAPGTQCGNDPTNISYIRWGEGQFDCILASDVGDITNSEFVSTDLEYYDSLSPAWVAAQSKIDKRALFRRPQPGMPHANRMETALNMGGFDITDVTTADSNELNANDDPNNSFTIRNELEVTDQATLRNATFEQGLNADRLLGEFTLVGESIVANTINAETLDMDNTIYATNLQQNGEDPLKISPIDENTKITLQVLSPPGPGGASNTGIITIRSQGSITVDREDGDEDDGLLTFSPLSSTTVEITDETRITSYDGFSKAFLTGTANLIFSNPDADSDDFTLTSPDNSIELAIREGLKVENDSDADPPPDETGIYAPTIYYREIRPLE